MLAAPSRSGILVGYAIATLIRWLAVASLVTVVALLAQMDVGGDGVDLFGLYVLAMLLNIAGTLWATGVAMRLRSQQAAPVMQMPVFLILFFAPVYVPLDLLEGWIHGVASVNPLTALLEAGRGLISGSPELTLAAFAIVAGLVFGFSLWAIRGLRRAEAAG
jgi:ABC-type multidrug transport system permease subunit